MLMTGKVIKVSTVYLNIENNMNEGILIKITDF